MVVLQLQVVGIVIHVLHLRVEDLEKDVVVEHAAVDLCVKLLHMGDRVCHQQVIHVTEGRPIVELMARGTKYLPVIQQGTTFQLEDVILGVMEILVKQGVVHQDNVSVHLMEQDQRFVVQID